MPKFEPKPKPWPAQFEVAIAGGGPAGCAAAIILAKAGHRVLLADAAPGGTFRVGEGLPPAARSLLNDLGVMPQFLADQHRTSFGNVALWGSEQPQSSDFLLQLQGHGFQLDRVRFDAMLKQAAQQAGATVLQRQRLTLLDSGTPDTNSAIHLQLQARPGTEATSTQAHWLDGEQISADFLIDATGRNASLARKLGATREQFDQLLAFHTLLESPRPTDQDGRTFIEAVANGWWYSVLLPSGARLVAFLSDADLVDKATLLSPTGFYQQLMATRFLSQLCKQHGYQISRTPLGADACSSRLQQIAGANWLAVGDAALAFDPLSSQGIANAMYSGMAAARALHTHLSTHQAMSANPAPVLQQYAQHLNQIFNRYLAHRHSYYGDEGRWADQPFWQRRQTNMEQI